MAELSKQDCIYILQNPLEHRIHDVRIELQKAIGSDSSQPRTAEVSDDEGSDTTAADDKLDAISSLLGAIQTHRVARKLCSSRGGGTVAVELAFLYIRLGTDRLQTSHFLPLVDAVIQKATDVEIWKQVLTLISSTSRLNPPPSASASFGGTPSTHSSASHQGSEQIARLVEDALKHELRNDVLIDVPDYFEKYFDGKSWTEKSVEIYESIKHTHVDGRWTTFPSNPAESAVWTWWSGFQNEHLTGSRGVYYTTKSKEELKGLGSESQLDIFIKSREVLVTSTADDQVRHDWADVLVIGEHTVSTNYSGKFWQLARYVRNVFSAQPRRTFVHGFILADTSMKLHTFDRSGAYCSKSFDIHHEPERFIRVICGYSMMSDEEFGLDTFVEQDGQKRFVTVNDEESGNKVRVEFAQVPIARRAAVVGRNTCCYPTVDQQSVIKFSWVSASRTPGEAELLRMATRRNVRGVPKLIAHRTFTSTGELRSLLTFTKKRPTRIPKGLLSRKQSGLSFSSQLASLPLSDEGKRKTDDRDQSLSKKSRFNSQAPKLSQVHETGNSSDNSQLSQTSQVSQPEEPYIDRILYCQVTKPAGRPLKDFRTPRGLLQALRDAIEAHRSLYVDGKILHRDISDGNIIITDPRANEGRYGMLIDLELGTIVEDGNNTRTESKRMTGTLKYMAIEVLEQGFCEGNPGIEHTYRHDLESFFYVFLDMCINQGWGDREGPKGDQLIYWYTGNNYSNMHDNYRSMFRAKLGDMSLDGFESLIVTQFSPALQCVKGMALSLRDVLFLRLPGRLRTGTPVEPPWVLYDEVIAVFDNSIEALLREEQDLRRRP